MKKIKKPFQTYTKNDKVGLPLRLEACSTHMKANQTLPIQNGSDYPFTVRSIKTIIRLDLNDKRANETALQNKEKSENL